MSPIILVMGGSTGVVKDYTIGKVYTIFYNWKVYKRRLKISFFVMFMLTSREDEKW